MAFSKTDGNCETTSRSRSNVSIPMYLYKEFPGELGRKFQREKKYKPKKEFAYRMCARRPTSAMPNRVFCANEPSAIPSGGGWLCFRGVSVVVM